MNLDRSFLNSDINDYIKEIKDYEILTSDEQRQLLEEVKNGLSDSYLKLFKSNLKLVVKIARRYIDNDSSLTLMDLIQEGNLGLLKAIDGYNLDFNIKFSTYAYDWIKLYIVRAIQNKGAIVRIPINRYKDLNNYDVAYEILYRELNRIPSFLELKEKLNINDDKLREIQKLKSLTETCSLNKIIDSDEKIDIMNLISSENSNILDDIIDKENNIERKKLFYKILEGIKLTELQMKVLILRYGLHDDKLRTYEEVAKILNMKDRRVVFEVEKRALNRIKKSIYLDDLRKIYIKK